MAFLKSRAAKTQGLCILLSICFAGMIVPVDAKKVSSDLPSSDKLSEGDTPQAAAADKDKATLNQSLAPVGLHDDDQAAKPATPEEGGDGTAMLKSTVSETDFKAKAKAGSGDKDAVASGKSESVVDKKKLSQKLKDKKAKPVAPNVGPIALQETDGETIAKAEATMTAEQRQMSELWQSTIDRNPDIQFVMQKLQPNSDANHAMAGTMKFLTATLCGAMNMAPFMLPGGVGQANPAALMGVGSGSGIIQGLFQDKAMKGAKKQAISQEQATILYKIVRDTADKLVASYRDYKKEQVSIDRASTDLSDLKSMVAESRQGQDPAKQLDMEYTLRKAKRDIDEKVEQAKLYRQQLTDLAGGEAIAKLDKEVIDEQNAVEMLTGTSGTPGQDQGNVGDFDGKVAKQQPGPFTNPLTNTQQSLDGLKDRVQDAANPKNKTL